MKPVFDSKDIAQIETRGIHSESVQQQIDIFKRGNIPVNLSEAATLKNGILEISPEEKEALKSIFEARKEELDLLKFVPASGAATRMFKSFYTFLQEFHPEEESLDTYLDRRENQDLVRFFARIKNLPFFEEVKQLIPNYEELSPETQQLQFVKKMLQEDGLNLGNLPKGLIVFHKYPEHSVTAFEEHLVEAAEYATSNGVARVHFTVSQEHRQKFEEEFQRIQPRLENELGIQFQISYSFQDPKTDTIAVDLSNEAFRDDKGNLLFRPGGHGSLLNNLNQQDADLIFIKNIDNVVTPRNHDLMCQYKKVLAGKLLQLQEKIFGFMRILEEEEISEEVLEELVIFSREELNIGFGGDFLELNREEKIALLKKKLNRPIRVCGMVKNEGEPGGGPFWVLQKTGELSLQIVESAQIDLDNYQQSKIAQEATDFNPVDIVCGIRDYKGKKFDLSNYLNPDTNFISNKTHDGKELKALEHPGLWNGSMADWITVFVQVPVETFNPVKTVADLLKSSHKVR